ncbi:MAG: glucose-6-phosphate isomerase [Sulfuricurvum sp.]|uniref:glucose-6-phosphate isomerase n=1 Tax=Sulfuricurvum sp. TaxID=2025608 RepID=UPI002614C75D|nr:glucose-6-phosphate isomerase [Sulfuricurvum sp.]MDD2829486.1 glucose-6-phosphate isomerase [Sulfuricurvum sp.]MDD4949517.1 glucose-6-phosphate isomerase [Sulfuricurvum sp.]
MIFSKELCCTENEESKQRKEKAFTVVTHEYTSGKIGYYGLPISSIKTVDEVKLLEDQNPFLASGTISDIALIGIGGSSLGVKGIDSLLKAKKIPTRNLHFFENTDPTNISKTLSTLTKENTLFIVASKSGTTIETISILKTVISYYGLDIEGDDRNRILVITDAGSSLSKFADHHGMRQFAIPLNVGGRFSVLSAVGIVPLTLAGYDTKAILAGAQTFLESFFSRHEDHLLEKGCFLFENSATITTNILFAYANELENMCKWYVQLWGESLGKIDFHGKTVGLTPQALIGSVDQHSFLQLLIEGPKDKSVTFINILDFESDLMIPTLSLKYLEKTDFVHGKSFNELINLQCAATKESLVLSGVPTDQLSFEKIDEANIGTMILYYELLTSVVGAMMEINPYDQPGVELGKQILYKKFDT